MRNLSMGTEGLPGIFPLILFLYFCILVNLLLFVFNLVPFPFLDGGKILMHYLPYERRQVLPALRASSSCSSSSSSASTSSCSSSSPFLTSSTILLFTL